jgi:hypothetical protein
MTNKHTPGPWEQTQNADGDWAIFQRRRNGKSICLLLDPDGECVGSQANGTLSVIEPSHPMRQAHRIVVEQARRADEYAAQHPYVETSVEEDSFRYPSERNIDTRNVHRLRQRT